MQAVVIREHGGFEQLRFEDRPTPEPGPGEVRVRLRAVGLNHLDVWVRRGVPGHKFPLPLVSGSDGAGVVDKLGAGRHQVAEGEEVVILPGTSCRHCDACLAGQDNLCPEFGILGESRDGTGAEQVVVPSVNVAQKPKNLGFPEAAAMPLAFMTAWSMLVRRARLQASETVLVHAAGSGVGSAAIQIAKLLGAVVIATARGPAKCERARLLGADLAIDYETKSFVEEVRATTRRRGVEVVFEHVGAATFQDSIRCLARGGRLVTCGATTGGEVTISLHQLFFKNLALLGNTMGTLGDARRILRLAAQGKLKPVLDRTLPFTQVREAHELLERRELFGKVALEL